MRKAWLAMVLGTLLTACGTVTPFRVQQRLPLGLPGVQVGFPGAFGGLRPFPFRPIGALQPLRPVVTPGGMAVGGPPKPPPIGGGQVKPPPVGGGQVSQPPVGGGQVTQPPVGGGLVTQPPVGGGQIVQPPVGGGQVAQPPVGGGQMVQPATSGQGGAAPTQEPAKAALLTLVPKGAAAVGKPEGSAGPTGIPDITRGTFKLLEGNAVAVILSDGTTLSGSSQSGKDQISFTLKNDASGSIRGILTMQVGEPYTAAYVITDAGGRVFTVRQEYTKP